MDVPPEKIALVTGGAGGVGKEIATGLAKRGVRVVIAGRSAEKGRLAERELRETVPGADVQFMQADLSLMKDVNRFADAFRQRFQKLDYLVLNAGIVQGKRKLTAEGIESNFATNYLGRFLLTQRLLPPMSAAGVPGAAARIVVISGAATNGKIHYDDVNLSRNFGIFTVAPQFCEANDVFVIEQARRLALSGEAPAVTIAALKIGAVRTGIRKTFPAWMKVVVPLIIDPLLGQTKEEIANSALHLIADPRFEAQTGALYTHIKRFKPIRPGRRTASPEEGRRLWDLSARLTSADRSDDLPPGPGTPNPAIA